MSDFKIPKHELLRAIWIIRNWSESIGNMQKPEEILYKIHTFSSEVFEKHEKMDLD